MAIILRGVLFEEGDSPTADDLNNLVGLATFGPGAVDLATTTLSGSGAIIVRDGGITPAKLSSGGPTWSGGTTTVSGLTATLATINTANAATLNVTGTTSLYEVVEKATVSTVALTGTVDFNVLGGSVVLYTTDAAANWVLNVRGSGTQTLNAITSEGDSFTIAVLATQGDTAYRPTSLTIDGGAVTPKWAGGTAPTAGNASSIDVYTYTIIKTGASNEYTVLASQTKFA